MYSIVMSFTGVLQQEAHSDESFNCCTPYNVIIIISLRSTELKSDAGDFTGVVELSCTMLGHCLSVLVIV